MNPFHSFRSQSPEVSLRGATRGAPASLIAPPYDVGALKATVVGSVLLTLAGVALLLTVGFTLALWLPAWAVALAFTVLLTVAALAVLRSVPGSFSAGATAPELSPAPTLTSELDAVDVAAIEEIDSEELEPETDRANTLGARHEAKLESNRLRRNPASALHPAQTLG